MTESSARSRLEGDIQTSATPKPTEEQAAPSDASQDLLVGNAVEKDSDTQLSTDSCVRQNEGTNANDQNTVDSTSDLQSERSIGVASQGDHTEPVIVKEITVSSADGLENVNTEHRDSHTDTTCIEDEAATILNDGSSNGFDDPEETSECSLQSRGSRHVQFIDIHSYQFIILQETWAWSIAMLWFCAGDTDALDDAESDDGFGGFEEADARSLAEDNGGDDEGDVKPEVLSSRESNIPKLTPALSAASSSADIFTTGRKDFLAQVRLLSSCEVHLVFLWNIVSGHLEHSQSLSPNISTPEKLKSFVTHTLYSA